MKNSSAAQKAQEADAPTMTIVKPQEEKKAEVINKTKAEDVQFSPVQEQPKIDTIEDIKRKGEILTLLTKRHDDLIQKRKRLESFAIVNDTDTAEISLRDAKGETFKSHSPKAIAKFIEFCKEEFSFSLKEIENEMRETA